MSKSHPTSSFALYHEKQVLRRCGLHAINALHGAPRAHTSRSLASLARKLRASAPQDGPRPGRVALAHPLFGNYDVSLLTAALANPPNGEHAPLYTRWVGPADAGLVLAAGRALINVRRKDSLVGPGVELEGGDVPERHGLAALMDWESVRHWLALVALPNGVWYIVDSERNGPVKLSGVQSVFAFLAHVFACEGQVLAVSGHELVAGV